MFEGGFGRDSLATSGWSSDGGSSKREIDLLFWASFGWFVAVVYSFMDRGGFGEGKSSPPASGEAMATSWLRWLLSQSFSRNKKVLNSKLLLIFVSEHGAMAMAGWSDERGLDEVTLTVETMRCDRDGGDELLWRADCRETMATWRHRKTTQFSNAYGFSLIWSLSTDRYEDTFQFIDIYNIINFLIS